MDQTFVNHYVIPSAVSVAVGTVAAIALLMVINSSLLSLPSQGPGHIRAPGPASSSETATDLASKYAVIADRNLFRSQLQVELPKPKTEKELEEEHFWNQVKSFSLKGVWIGADKKDHFAFIDKGPQKGVWIHRNGESMEGGVVLTEIRANSVLITKGDFGATLTLFTKGAERTDIRKKPEQK
mgnify:CR=1 FL=1